MGELSRMTQYKEKSQKHVLSNRTTSAPTGLFMYPVLMAADILLYDADFVIVGNDQKQHIELTRDVALRMNNKYGKLFKVPEPIIPKHGARIMDLVNPLIKMSKSNLNEKGTIFLLDKPQDVINKINSAKTDSLNKVKYDPQNQPGISNLLVIYSCLTNLEINGIVDKYKEQTYSIFKNDLAKIVSDFLINFQSKYEHIINDSQKLTRILEQNAKKCKAIADNKLLNIYRSIGLIK
jgi:tryptophanyl-tRNA synthetase